MQRQSFGGIFAGQVCTFMWFSSDPLKSFAAFFRLFASYTSLIKCIDSSPYQKLTSFDASQQLSPLGVLKTPDNKQVRPSCWPPPTLQACADLYPPQKQTPCFHPTSLSSSKKHIFFYSIHFFFFFTKT